MKESSRELIAWGAAIAVAVVGVIVLTAGLLTPVSIGWFAYQPLANATYAPSGSGMFVSRMTVIGCVLLALSLIGIAFLIGRRAGARQRS